MKKIKRSLFILPILAAAAVGTSSCGSYDEEITIYNWGDYIYEGTDDMGNIVDDGTIALFQNYYNEKTGKSIKVNYETFATPEEMYKQIKIGAISPDLCCPSDYMIQKMANEGLLESFSYTESTGEYGESLSNWATYGSPFIKDKFSSAKLDDGNSFLTYAVPYFWGTMGWTYDPDYFDADEVSTWECLWSSEAKYQQAFSLKDSMRDTYVAAIFHVFKDEIAAIPEDAEDYNARLTAYFNKCDDETIAKVKAALLEAKRTTVKVFEVDEGKDDIVKGNYHANLAWSGDAVYAMDNAEEAGKQLNYSMPAEGSNIWFDGWCMPKGANKELAEEFINFISRPDIAALNMDYVGYTSPIAGQEIWDLINDWYAAEDGVEADDVDLSYFFGDTLEEGAVIAVPTEERGRQFDAQYPSESDLKRLCIMNDYGSQQSKVEDMWAEVTAAI